MNYSPFGILLCPEIFCKAQGQTIQGKFSLYLSRGEKEHGLSYVAMSCVTCFYVIGIYEGIMHNHIYKLI